MPVLTDEEVNTVRESCRQLGAIGRNLNQVARALNIEFRESDKLKQEAIEKLAERIDQHLDHVSELFDKTWSRWHELQRDPGRVPETGTLRGRASRSRR
uniref:plasmid mobilization relaxosome protein MobC n=1 Tax=Klebsiella pneumoniae TaxID=573 RepID=UPI002931AD04